MGKITDVSKGHFTKCKKCGKPLEYFVDYIYPLNRCASCHDERLKNRIHRKGRVKE